MRRLSSCLALGAIVLTSFLATDRATAQTFPNPPTTATPFWIPITRAGAPVIDASNANNDARDIVGDATHPAAFVASDASFLYLRVRVNGDPGAAEDRGFGCLINTDAQLADYEFLVTYDGNGTDTIRYFANGTKTPNNTTNNPAETALGTFPATSHGKIMATGDAVFPTTAPTADYFVDIAVPWTTIRTGPPVVAANAALRFICGTSTNATAAKDLNSDIFDGAALQTLAGWSDAYTCNNGGNPRCVTATDSDGDGVQNAAETGFGTSTTNFDSDGDGIPDYFELLASTSVISFTGVNTDGDAKIDALDTDSDNDCTLDSADKLASYRDQAAPNAQASAACSGALPICNKTLGVCAACNGDQGSVSTLPCYDGAKPYCDPSGRCSECTTAKTFACTTVKPACDEATGVCAACNGDRLSAATAACPNTLTPACNASGSLAGTCTTCSATNTSLCTLPMPACSTVLGTCAQCTGDNGDGAATAPCPTAASPACNATGTFKGRCTTCSVSNVGKCPTDKPTCDPNAGVCAPCDGDRNSGTLFGCPTAAAPTCAVDGANKGQCAKCASSADCGIGHTGPTCDLASGACMDVDTDADGIQDEVELLLGTDPTKKDTDGDGIDDKTEVTPQGGGSFAKIDTDEDTTPDALDEDSDGDGILDKDEWDAAGPLLDTDADKIPNFRDVDDDGDGVNTADEIADATKAKVSDDVDTDGKKNWLDDDANGNSLTDGIDKRDDDDGDGIPNYLDLKKDEPVADAGTPVDSGATSSSSSSSSGFTKTPFDAGTGGKEPGAAPDEGVLEGSGCSATGGGRVSIVALMLGVLGLGLVTRRRRR